jgi:hypothetical protein
MASLESMLRQVGAMDPSRWPGGRWALTRSAVGQVDLPTAQHWGQGCKGYVTPEEFDRMCTTLSIRLNEREWDAVLDFADPRMKGRWTGESCRA